MDISIHALLAESDHQNMKYVEEVSISIHALLAESDPCAWYAPAGAHISIHALLAESDTDRMFCSRQRLNFYPRSPCGERPSAAAPIKLTRSISIHALLAESDFLEMRQWAQGIIISIHALLAESDRGRSCFQPEEGNRFLSTLSLRRATRRVCLKCPPRTISIHALLAESDCRTAGALLLWWIFLSTLSLRRATAC